jgi:hypothetical protein
VHDPPGARVVPVQVSAPAVSTLLKNQVSMLEPVPEVTVTVLTVTDDVVEAFASVTVPVPVKVPVGKVIVSGLGAIETVPVPPTVPPPAMYSTAPMSIGFPLPLSGRGLPKKSVDGASP